MSILCSRIKAREFLYICVSAYIVLEEEDPTEETEEVRGEQGEIDGGGTAQFHHDGHTAVQSIHTQRIGREQEP